MRRYFCRSVEFDDQTKQCILSEEDSISQKDDISVSSSPTHHFYDLVCLDNRKYKTAIKSKQLFFVRLVHKFILRNVNTEYKDGTNESYIFCYFVCDLMKTRNFTNQQNII